MGVVSSFYVIDIYIYIYLTNISRAVLILKINSWGLSAGAGYRMEPGQ